MTEPTDAEHIPHTCGGFSGAFYGHHKRMPSAQEIWDAAIRSYRDLNRAPPAVVGEPYGYVYTVQVAPIVGDERKVERTVFTRNKPPCDAIALYTTPQPTQAQAGAVPLTDEQLYEERQTAISQLFDLAQQWADNKIHSYQFGHEAEKIVDAVARRVEAAHGIKGGQHGAAAIRKLKEDTQ